jgi:hypothetical protein
MRTPRRVRVQGPKPIGYAPIPGLKIKVKAYDRLAKQYLDLAGEIFESSGGLDTCVRDSVATGLAYIVHAAYDSQACSVNMDMGTDREFIAKKVEEWFTSRGFVDWFAHGASVLFDTSRREVFHILTTKTRRGHRVLTRVKVA